MHINETMESELMTKADLQVVQATLIKWIVGTGILVFLALQVSVRLLWAVG